MGVVVYVCTDHVVTIGGRKVPIGRNAGGGVQRTGAGATARIAGAAGVGQGPSGRRSLLADCVIANRDRVRPPERAARSGRRSDLGVQRIRTGYRKGERSGSCSLNDLDDLERDRSLIRSTVAQGDVCGYRTACRYRSRSEGTVARRRDSGDGLNARHVRRIANPARRHGFSERLRARQNVIEVDFLCSSNRRNREASCYSGASTSEIERAVTTNCVLHQNQIR